MNDVDTKVNTPGEEQEQHEASRSRRLRVAVALVISVAIAGGAFWGELAGYGVFGHRLMLYGENNLYVLNLDDEERYVSIEGGELEKVGAEGARLLHIVGGEAKVEVFDGDWEALDSWTVVTDRSHAFLNLSTDACIAVSEVSGLPDGDDIAVDMVDWLEPDTTLYALETRTVLWPRMDPGVLEYGETQGAVISVEPADCTLSGDDEFLAEYLQRRIEERLAPPEL